VESVLATLQLTVPPATREWIAPVVQADRLAAAWERIVLAVEADSAAAQVQAFARAQWVPDSAAEIE
jgi:hypothetical protein